MLAFLFPRRARIVIRRRGDTLQVKVGGRLEKYAARIHTFVREEQMPAGTVTLGLNWRYRFRGFSAAQEQQFRNFLSAECGVLPTGRRPGKRASG